MFRQIIIKLNNDDYTPFINSLVKKTYINNKVIVTAIGIFDIERYDKFYSKTLENYKKEIFID